MRALAAAIGMLGLAWLGFQHDSDWAFAGAVVLFASVWFNA